MKNSKKIVAVAFGLLSMVAASKTASADNGGCWRTEVCYPWGYSCTGTECSLGPLCCKGVCAQT